MNEKIVSINHNCIYIPKSFMTKAGFKQNERVILRVTENGIAFAKVGIFEDLDVFFTELDEGLQKLFIKEKNEQINKKYH